MTDRTACGGLEVASELYRFITDEAIPGTGVDAREFSGLGIRICPI